MSTPTTASSTSSTVSCCPDEPCITPAPAAPRRCRVLRSREIFLALHEIRRGLIRSGLLAMAISLSLFLVLFQQALQDGLLTSFVGALRNQSAKPGSCVACSCRTQTGAWNDMLAVCPGHAPASANGSVSHPVTSELPDGRRGELIWIPWWRHHRPPPSGPGRDREGFSGAVSGHVSRRRIGRSVRVRAPRTVGPPPSPSSPTTPTPRSTGRLHVTGGDERVVRAGDLVSPGRRTTGADGAGRARRAPPLSLAASDESVVKGCQETPVFLCWYLKGSIPHSVVVISAPHGPGDVGPAMGGETFGRGSDPPEAPHMITVRPALESAASPPGTPWTRPSSNGCSTSIGRRASAPWRRRDASWSTVTTS